ncbi:CHAT domain-containing protein [Actinoplanes sp. CA-054009]
MTDRFAQDVDRRLELAREWDELVGEVRRLPGFHDFLRPPRLETLLPAASGGPVVLLNISRWQCDALIVTTSGVRAVPLPDLTLDAVVAQVRDYLDAVGERQEATLRGAARRDLDLPAGDDVEEALSECLLWMWESFARTVLDELGHTSEPAGEWPRVWWCPTGPLTLLPLHAAGDHRVPGASVLDRVISSYTPTLRALREARNGRSERSGERQRMLFVGMPDTPGQASLPNVRLEQRLIAERFPGRHTALVGDAARRAAVLGAIPAYDWVHFACHGEQNLADPSRGGLLLHDGSLTVTDVSDRPHQGEFAYLSGCKTALGGADLPDEAITLAAALHYTGFRHVIATLWSVWDAEAAQVADDVYRAVVRDGRLHADEAAAALHHAVRLLREQRPGTPSVWTPFAHTGP